jgi:hypothetical protein
LGSGGHRLYVLVSLSINLDEFETSSQAQVCECNDGPSCGTEGEGQSDFVLGYEVHWSCLFSSLRFCSSDLRHGLYLGLQ